MQCFRCEPCGFNLCEGCFVEFGGVVETSTIATDDPRREGKSIRRALACFRTDVQEPHHVGKAQDQDKQQGQQQPVEQLNPQAENGGLESQPTKQELQPQVQAPEQPLPPPKAKKGKPSEADRSAAVRHALAGGLAGFLCRAGRNVAAPTRPPPPEATVVATSASTEALQKPTTASAGAQSQPLVLPVPTSTMAAPQHAMSAHVQHDTVAQQAAGVATSSDDDESQMRLGSTARPSGTTRHGDMSRHSASSAASVHMSRHSQQSLQEQHPRAGNISRSGAVPVASTELHGAGVAGVARPQVGIGGVDSSFASRHSSSRQNDLEPQQHRERAHSSSHMQVEEIGQSGIGGSSMSSVALPMGTRQNTSGLQQSRGRQSDVSAMHSEGRHNNSGVQQFHMSSISDDDSDDLGQVVNIGGNARPGAQASTLRSDTSGDLSMVQGFGAQARQDLTDISSVPSAHAGGSRVREVNNARGLGAKDMVLDSASEDDDDDDDDEGPSGPTHYPVRSGVPSSRPAAAKAAAARPVAVSSAAPRGGFGTPPAGGAGSAGIQPFSPVSVSSLSDDGPAMMGGRPPGPPTRTLPRNDIMMEESVESM